MSDIDTYLSTTAFTDDAARFGFEPSPAAVLAHPPASFLARLPASARASLDVLIALAKRGALPYLYRFNTTMVWGFDFKANDVEVLNSDFEGDLSGDVFSLASDGGGNHVCLRADGAVVTWNHEESNLEDHTQFASLDEALWCLTRREAIGDERLAWDEVKATFTARAGGKENGWSFFAEEIEESLE